MQKRGELMGEHGEGGMMALTVDVDLARAIADRHYCQVAGCNLPEQTVVGGRELDLEALAADIAENYPAQARGSIGDGGRVSHVLHGDGRPVVSRGSRGDGFRFAAGRCACELYGRCA